MKGIIYKWTCNVNGKSYIGQTTNEIKREKSFLNEKESYAGAKIDNARKKYGLAEGTWTKTVLKRLWCKDGKEDELRERLNYWERYYVVLFNTVKEGYNMTDGGDGKFSTEVLQEMSRKGKELWNNLSEEEKEKWKNKSKNYWYSLNKKEKEKLIGKSKIKYKEWCNSLSEEELIKKRKASLGTYRGHHIKRNLNSSKINKGRNHTEEFKEKLRKKNKEKPIVTSAKTVEKYTKDKSTLLETFNTIIDASKSVCVNPDTFSKNIKNKNGFYKDFYWVIKDSHKINKYPSGCLWDKRIQRWRSRIGDTHLGSYKTVEAASEIYQIAKKKKEEGIFDEWYKDIFEHKLAMYEKYGEKIYNA